MNWGGNMKETKVTIRDVATAAGVSIATISRVLNNHPEVKFATAKQVRQVMQNINYQIVPNHIRRGHRRFSRRPDSYRKMQIALITQVAPPLLEAPIYSRIIRSIEQELTLQYYSLLLRNLPMNAPKESIPGKIDGAILFYVGHIQPAAMRLLRQIPCVKILGTPQPYDCFDHVTYDDEKIGVIAAQYLARRGHRKVVCYGKHAGRVDAFLKTVRNAGIKCLHIAEDGVDETHERQYPDLPRLHCFLENICKERVRPTAFFATADIVIAGFQRLLPKFNLVPQKDVELIGVNNDAVLLDNLEPRPATIDIHVEEIGRTALQLLFQRQKEPHRLPELIRLEPELVENNQRRAL